ncbi:MerR family transcriptional regulator [Clostridium sp. YIM B02515]|uniref:MerR family transcriptional regulator n=1 Tax=Clostridium rhizosphaerae TaxID=2803861 RepID=A0ABS1TED3_9CLOT|nr:MerR family transcriptional regulator [Clostridium rhizosphaerae]MBL4937741.1 MerR family transcriptional regulator [Clostridium rhizosphaerae]
MNEKNNKLHTIGDVCEAINKKGFKDFKTHNLRYLEKVLDGVFEINRDEYLNRLYTDDDISKIEMILRLKDQGLNYAAIKSILLQSKTKESPSDEVASEIIIENTAEVQEKDIIIPHGNIEIFKEIMKSIITESIQSSITPKIEDLRKDLVDLKIQNIDLKIALEKQQEDHFNHLDEKLIKWREENNNKNRPWYKKLFI